MVKIYEIVLKNSLVRSADIFTVVLQYLKNSCGNLRINQEYLMPAVHLTVEIQIKCGCSRNFQIANTTMHHKVSEQWSFPGMSFLTSSLDQETMPNSLTINLSSKDLVVHFNKDQQRK